MEFEDQVGRRFQLNKVPGRIVSLVPSQTELIVALGMQESLVGVTKFCVHPKELRKTKTVVGGTKQVHIDKIKELSPELIFCNKEENTREMVAELEKIAPVHVSEVKTVLDNNKLIKAYGSLLHCEEKAGCLIAKIEKARTDFRTLCKNKPSKTVLYFIWKDPWMVVGGDTFINEMLEENNFQNLYSHRLRYPETDLKNLSVSQLPELVFLSSEPYPFKEKHQKELQAYFSNSTIVLVNGEYFSWYGSRLEKAYSYFEKLHRRLEKI
jgi:iron complex transport system substrate-binding protein